MFTRREAMERRRVTPSVLAVCWAMFTGCAPASTPGVVPNEKRTVGESDQRTVGEPPRAINSEVWQCPGGRAPPCVAPPAPLAMRPRAMPLKESDAPGPSAPKPQALDPDCAAGNARACGRACDDHSALACHALATLYTDGKGVPKDGGRALEFLERACVAGHPESCEMSSDAYGKAFTAASERMHALEADIAACKTRDARACSTLGMSCNDMQRVYRARLSDDKRAVQLRPADVAACKSGNARACSAICKEPEDFQNPAKTPEERDTLSRSCDRGDGEACKRLGDTYDAGGMAGPPDEAAAAKAYERACDRGVATACMGAATPYDTGIGVASDRARAFGLYERGCKGGDVGACLLGTLDPPKDVDTPRREAMVRRACDIDGRMGCVTMGLLKLEHDDAGAAQLFRKACDHGDPDGCLNLGTLYELGRGVAFDLAAGLLFYDRACLTGSPKACGRLGLCYLRARPGDASRGTELLRLACEHRDAKSCSILKHAK